MCGVGEERVARRYEGHLDEGERWRRQVVEERGYLQVVDEDAHEHVEKRNRTVMRRSHGLGVAVGSGAEHVRDMSRRVGDGIFGVESGDSPDGETSVDERAKHPAAPARGAYYGHGIGYPTHKTHSLSA